MIITRYYLLMSLMFVAFLLTMLIYFQATQPESAFQTKITETLYVEANIKGPIQPLPQIASFNGDWVRLGKALFNSTLLSSDNTISCASCHLVNYGGDDGFPVSTGVANQTGQRNAPTVFNSVFNFRQFWDGRSKDLAAQVSGPIHNPLEMNSNWEEVIAKLKQEPQFSSAFAELSPDGITPKTVAKAITSYEETLITPGAPIDRYLMGESNALNPQQKRGYEKFLQFGCITCHQGKNIGGNFYQKLGRIDLAPDYLLSDNGLYDLTGKESDRFVFKVPSLRNVAETAPYFHNGSVGTLHEAVRIMARVQLGIELKDEDIEDLVALLESFTGTLTLAEQL